MQSAKSLGPEVSSLATPALALKSTNHQRASPKQHPRRKNVRLLLIIESQPALHLCDPKPSSQSRKSSKGRPMWSERMTSRIIGSEVAK